MDSFPTEIYELIIGFCFGLDLTSLRLVCSLFNCIVLSDKNLSSHMCRKKAVVNTTYFREKSVISCKSDDSLKRLRWICRHLSTYKFVLVTCDNNRTKRIYKVIEATLTFPLSVLVDYQNTHNLYLQDDEYVLRKLRPTWDIGTFYLKKYNIKVVYTFLTKSNHYDCNLLSDPHQKIYMRGI